MLTIRLQRAGKKNKPEYRVILAEKTAASQKKFVEVLGNYNPHNKTFTIKDQARLKYWMEEQHVKASPTVHNLLVTNKLISEDKVKAFTLPKKEVEEVPAEETPAASETPAEVSVEEAPTEAASETPVEAASEEASAPEESPEEPKAE